jgi:hypothetical protein
MRARSVLRASPWCLFAPMHLLFVQGSLETREVFDTTCAQLLNEH